MSELKYYPCTMLNGKISQRQSDKPMSRIDAESYLKQYHLNEYRKCEAIPQPVNHHYFTGV